MPSDQWLTPWLPLIAERSGGHPILELGCGSGRDTSTLNREGHRVIGIDISRLSLAVAKLRVPDAEFVCQNILDAFPLGREATRIIVASLSLHYFPWTETVQLVRRIHETLQPAGVLLCRLNSTNDRNFGAASDQRLADNYYLVNGRPKRFFDREDVNRLFSDGWHVLNVEQTTINRYALPKAVWEVVLDRRA